jgi:ferrochelatase
MDAPRQGVLLVNLGTPDAPTPRAVRRYLREFLGDPRVLDMPALARWLLLNGVILPTRPRRAAAAYQKIWTEAGSPLVVNGFALRDALRKELGDDWVVEVGMRYGVPSIDGAVERLASADVERIHVVPLFPQYASASTGSALDAVYSAAAGRHNVPPLVVLPPFYGETGFIRCLAAVARSLPEEQWPDHLLISFHGLPEHQVKQSDETGAHCFASADCCDEIGAANRHCYRAQCNATARALAQALRLRPEHWTMSFQSRLGRRPWIRPYTDELLPELFARGVRKLAVICPSFAADCLETLEEIGIRARAQWLALGGEDHVLVPCLNADPLWVTTLAGWLRSRS